MNIELILKENVVKAIAALYNTSVITDSVQINATPKNFEGNYSVVVFPYLKLSGKGPEDTGREIGAFLKGKTDIADLDAFLQAPDWTNANSLRSFTKLIGASEELTANPYFSPLIWAAALQTKDKLREYELLQSASEFNKDPLLWAKKIQAAQDLGLDRYATEAREEMKNWMSEEEIEALLGEMY